jgi:short-subunit dehydrogenase
VIVITGTSSGFGFLTAVELANRNNQVIATMRDLSKQKELSKSGPSIDIRKLDVCDHDSINTTIAQIIEQYGKIDVLINNAGIAIGGFCEDLSLESYREQLETNFFGLVAMTKAVISTMRQQKSGKIINLSSVAGCFGFPALSPYASSKFAVEGFSESLRYELLPFGIFVSLVEPGSYQTDIWEKGLRRFAESSESPYYPMEQILLGVSKNATSSGDPSDVVRVINKIVETKRPKLRLSCGEGRTISDIVKKVFSWPFD